MGCLIELSTNKNGIPSQDVTGFYSNMAYNQVEQTKVTSIVNMTNGFVVKQDISPSWTNKIDILG